MERRRLLSAGVLSVLPFLGVKSVKASPQEPEEFYKIQVGQKGGRPCGAPYIGIRNDWRMSDEFLKDFVYLLNKARAERLR